MNKVLVFAIVAGLAISAQAAPKKSMRVAALGSADQSTSTSLQTETVMMDDVAPVVPEKKWSAVLESENYKGAATNLYAGDAVADEKGEVKYKINDRSSISLAQEWSRSYAGDAYTHTTLNDTSIRYTRSGYKLPSNIDFAAQGRVYVPTSTASQDAGQITQLRLYNMFSKPVAKNVEIALLVCPRLFVQDNAGSDEAGANQFRLFNSFGVKYSLSDKVAFEQTVGMYSKWKNGTERADNLDASTSVYIAATSWLDLNIGLRQADDASNVRNSGASLYAADQSEYFAIATFSM